jgi:hypothetical protein
MPIRPDLRRFYGAAWRAYRLALIRARGNRCSVCDLEVTRYLNVCHLSHDPRNSSVALMCPADHNRHDAGHRYAVQRRNRARRTGQLWLWPEVQWAPFAAWMQPRALRGERVRQGDLFA